MNTERTLQSFADNIKELRKQLKEREGDWISVADAMPEEGTRIFCKNEKGGLWAEAFDRSEPIGTLAFWMLIKYPNGKKK